MTPTHRPRILVVEDEVVIRHELRRVLALEGYDVDEAGDVREAKVKSLASFDLIVSDLRLPGEDGDVLIDLGRQAGEVPVVLMTAFGSVPSAVDAMKRGAVDYLTKPFGPDELVVVVARALEARGHRKGASAQGDEGGLLGSSPAMETLRRRIAKLATSEARVLIVGESGTGKELVARALHEQSARRDRPFVPVNCAAIPEGLIESELFGHERGAFTGAVSAAGGLVQAAAGGTLFLDEIGELPLSAQARLLRLVQEGEIRKVGSNRTQRVDVRLLAATHRDLRSMVATGAFREDLYFRLRVLELSVPPLRARGGDVLELADFFMWRQVARRGIPPLTWSAAARAALLEHAWSGNVRELEHAVERAVTLHEHGSVGPELLGLQRGTEATVASLPNGAERPASELGEPTDCSLEAYFRRYVLEHQNALSETELARRLGISRKSLWERRQRYGIPRPRKS